MRARLAALPVVMILTFAVAGCDLFVEPSGPTPDDFARARAAYDEADPEGEPNGIDEPIEQDVRLTPEARAVARH